MSSATFGTLAPISVSSRRPGYADKAAVCKTIATVQCKVKSGEWGGISSGSKKPQVIKPCTNFATVHGVPQGMSCTLVNGPCLVLH